MRVEISANPVSAGHGLIYRQGSIVQRITRVNPTYFDQMTHVTVIKSHISINSPRMLPTITPVLPGASSWASGNKKYVNKMI